MSRKNKDDPDPVNSSLWRKDRDDYARTGDPRHLECMLSHVRANNPPPAEAKGSKKSGKK